MNDRTKQTRFSTLSIVGCAVTLIGILLMLNTYDYDIGVGKSSIIIPIICVFGVLLTLIGLKVNVYSRPVEVLIGVIPIAAFLFAVFASFILPAIRESVFPSPVIESHLSSQKLIRAATIINNIILFGGIASVILLLTPIMIHLFRKPAPDASGVENTDEQPKNTTDYDKLSFLLSLFMIIPSVSGYTIKDDLVPLLQSCSSAVIDMIGRYI